MKFLKILLLSVVPFGLLIMLFLMGIYNIEPDPWTTSHCPVSEEVDRLEIYTFSDSEGSRKKIGTVTNPRRIDRYRNAYQWTDYNAICCDESTRYIIYEYAGEERVGTSKYSYLLSGYNNTFFSLEQLLLILFS